MPAETKDPPTIVMKESPPAEPLHLPEPSIAPMLDPRVSLTMGMLTFTDGKNNTRRCEFQFNPTELERSRTVKFTRTATGNTLEEPNAGPRNQPKRKHTRKPDPWEITLSLRYDAGYYHDVGVKAGSFKHRVERITEAMRFFEALAEPGLRVSENESPANAHETPPPPVLLLSFARRTWQCAVKTLRIKEQDFTPDLYLRRFEVTLGLEALETVQQSDTGITGAAKGGK